MGYPTLLRSSVSYINSTRRQRQRTMCNVYNNNIRVLCTHTHTQTHTHAHGTHYTLVTYACVSLLHCATSSVRVRIERDIIMRARSYGVLKTLNLYSPQNRSMHNQTGIIITTRTVCPVFFFFSLLLPFLRSACLLSTA